MLELGLSEISADVRNICSDNAGENEAFEQLCKQEGISVKFEYAAPGTPHSNGRVERKFASLFNRVFAVLNYGEFSYFLRNGL